MILVFGSLNADFFLSVRTFPAPGETVLTPGALIKAGGKGANQAAAAAKAGGLVKMIGAVGTDEVAKVPITALRSLGVDCSAMQVSALPVQPVDTTGAGDAFVGIFAAMLDNGLDTRQAARYAAAGAGLACLKIGAQEALPSLKEIETRVEEIKIS